MTRVPGYIYCLIIFVIVLKKSYTISATLEEYRSLEAPSLQRIQSLEDSRFAIRISFYPLTCFICHSGVIATQIYYYYTSDASYILQTWRFIGISMTGLFNLIASLFDPALEEAFRRDPEDEETERTSSTYDQHSRNFRILHEPLTPT